MHLILYYNPYNKKHEKPNISDKADNENYNLYFISFPPF